tara:strand:+ start:866 stop:2674 length:1809 start_codon:yes stop_codon:yes gene_type:complete
MAEERIIKYVNKNFDDFRSQLIEHAKNYFPDTYNDFSATSPGMMFIEMASYVGDVLSFYQDTQLQETFLTYAKDPKNLFNLAYMMGYKPKVTGVSEVEITISQTVNADGAYNPTWADAAFIPAKSVVRSTDSSQTRFIIENPVDFQFSSSYDPTEVRIETLDGSNNPATYTLVKKAKAFSGTIETTSFTVNSTEKFKTLTLSDDNIVGILEVTGSTSGDSYFEVPFLGQDTIFTDSTNSSSDSNQVPYVLSLQKVPKRFVTRFKSNGDLELQFGAGTTSSDDSVILPDPTNVGSGTNQGIKRLDYAYDPSNFLYSKAYGVALNENITVKYIKGGGIAANVPANSITNKVEVTPTRGTLASLTFTNEKPAAGGRDGDTVEELRENALRSFSEQGRAVTLQDYTVRALSLPSKFGSIAKVYATQDQLTNTNTTDLIIDNNPLALSLYVLSYDNNKNLTTATNTLKTNLKTYLSEYMMLSDSINIKDAFVVNISLEYDVIVRPNYAGRDVLLNCNLAVQDYFKIEKRNINQPINLAEIYTLLDKVKGVQTVQEIKVNNLQGGNYSRYAYDIKGATKNNVVYPSFDPCIFEIKFPKSDIKGRVITN